MERQFEDLNILEKFVKEFVRVVEKYTEYLVCSGFVAISHGRSRGTEDVDMLINPLSKNEFALLHEDLIKNGFECLQSPNSEEVYLYLREGDSVRYTWEKEHLPEMEVKFAKDKLDEYQIKTRKKLPLSGLDFWFSSVEMNIAFKEELLKSPKDIEDAKHLRIVYEEELNEEEIEKIKSMIRYYRL